ncbi:MAG: hypothetical protein J6U54_07760 [Clostridiales bacterium]|nr:hypothetical protein [Clostridiales bacterium]
MFNFKEMRRNKVKEDLWNAIVDNEICAEKAQKESFDENGKLIYDVKSEKVRDIYREIARNQVKIAKIIFDARMIACSSDEEVVELYAEVLHEQLIEISERDREA